MAFGAGVSLHEIEPLNRHVKLGVFRVVKQHELAAFGRGNRCRRRLRRPQVKRDQSTEPRNAVIDVDDVVVYFEIAKVGKKRSGARASFFLALDGGAATFKRGLGGFVEQIAFDMDDQV